jgi:hypothetical protein
MRTVYQLHATGKLAFFSGKHSILSRQVYISEAAAREAIPEFRRTVTTVDDKPSTLTSLDDDGLVIHIYTLDLIEDRQDKSK